VIVPGVYSALQVTVAGHSATVLNQATRAAGAPAAIVSQPKQETRESHDARSQPMESATVSESSVLVEGLRASAAANDAVMHRVHTIPVGVPESLQTMQAHLKVTALKQEIWALAENVRRLSKELDQAHAQGLGSALYLRSLGGLPRVVLTFEDESARPRVDDGLLEGLGRAAQSANRIYLHGHTDAFVASESGTELAIRRAVEVRRLLISLNVEPERIRLFYRGAGNFAANNSTPEGKALNRRVEIELRQW